VEPMLRRAARVFGRGGGRRLRWTWGGLLASLLVVGCATSKAPRPSWVGAPPSDDDYYFGIGSAGPSLDSNPGKARGIAFARAVAYLGKAVRVRVTSQSRLVERNSWASYESESIQFSDEELAGVELVDVWEQFGGYDGRPQATWVLVRMPVARAQAVRALRP